KEDGIGRLLNLLDSSRHEGDNLRKWLQRTQIRWEEIVAWSPEAASFAPDVIEQVVLEAKYSGYIDRQAAQIERFQRMESRAIPPHFDFAAIPQLRMEAKEKLGRIRPSNLGQASRISGISPADLALVLLYLDTPGKRMPAGLERPVG
ncbi:MAG TPA: hypothetical protein VNX28_10600, partial [Gemmataceae bacterium]|nr:hypothetical protein [Gemmataceae bacterium]